MERYFQKALSHLPFTLGLRKVTYHHNNLVLGIDLNIHNVFWIIVILTFQYKPPSNKLYNLSQIYLKILSCLIITFSGSTDFKILEWFTSTAKKYQCTLQFTQDGHNIVLTMLDSDISTSHSVSLGANLNSWMKVVAGYNWTTGIVILLQRNM